ncbi:fibronectin type III domain-containing protein [Deminuibacter soli]|nr:fibronectin type III domain-containing protein [Deminuibacter soli]
MQKFYLVFAFACTTLLLLSISSIAQSVLDPNDAIVSYDANNPPTQPAYGTIGKWTRTKKLSWNTDSYKCYIYKGIAFRLKFPKTYNPTLNDGKQYPMLVFWHGAGESGDLSDNEYSMYHGGDVFKAAVDNGQFDGYILFMQSNGGFWGPQAYSACSELIEYMVTNNKLDPFRVSDNGLSAGGQGTWEMAMAYPTKIAAALPMSYTSIGYKDNSTVNTLKWTPIWNFQGGQDGSPAPQTSQQVRDAFLAAGGNYTYTEYPDLAHGTWDRAWTEPNFFPYLNAAHKANPWALTGKTQFCPGETVTATLGVTAGFDAYEWRKDGTIIPGATGNQITATAFGTYDCHVKKGNTWSVWSPIPIVLQQKAPTVPPIITVNGLATKVLPAPDSSTTVPLQVPDGYASYSWQSTSSATVLSTTRFLSAGVGSFKVQVSEKFGCASNFSAPFTVLSANGANGPDAPIGLSATAASKTQIKLIWSENPNPAFNETNYEVYQATAAAGPYRLIAFTGRDTTTYTASGLNANTAYYYKVRAVNNNAASISVGPASAITQADLTPPTAPTNLRSGGVSKSSVTLIWDAATDDVGVSNYDIYVNGVKSYSVGAQTTFTVYNLVEGSTYTFLVKARDLSGNISPFSNQAAIGAGYNGLNYSYYNGAWNNLPDFKTLTPVATGVTPNVTLNNRLDETNFAFLWTGYITIPVTGTYTFQTSSDDGSKLYIDSDYVFSAPATVNNDGLHGTVTVTSAPITLTAGAHKFNATFMQQGGGYVMNVLWKTPQTGGQFVAIPDSAFVEKITGGAVPTAPTNLTATAVSFNKINLSWTDTSSIETGTEIYRSTSAAGPYVTVATLKAGKTTYSDTTVQASTTYYYKIKDVGAYGSSPYNDEGFASLNYGYYETNVISVLPDFTTLAATKTGQINNFLFTPQNRTTNVAFNYTGNIKIATAGTYTFYTSSDDGSALYIDGALVVNNDGLHATQEKSGTKVLSAGFHTIRVGFFQQGGGEVLTVSYAGPGISKRAIPDSVMNVTPANATTQPLPNAPNVPSGFTVKGVTPNSVTLFWKDLNSNQTAYELYRSSNNNTSYGLIATIPSTDSVTYIDSNLFANAQYYYKVRAINNINASGYAPEVSATTSNNIPVVGALSDKSMRYGTSLQVNITATDADNEQLTTVLSNQPAFATFNSTGNGTATITFNPQQTNQGVYNNITVTVSDQHGGSKAVSFNLTVNDNYNPVINPISNVTLGEGSTAAVNVSGTDQNPSDAVALSFDNLPSFVTIGSNSAGAATLNVKPGYADNGIYTVTANASDGRGGTDSKTFTITVNDVSTSRKIYVNFTAGNKLASAPWNNTGKNPVLNDVYGPFKDDGGNQTTSTIKVLSSWQAQNPGANDVGVSTGNNSGVYPDNAISTAYYTAAGAVQTFKLTGLDTAASYTYNLTFFGSRSGVTDDRTSVYTVKGTSVSLNAASNSKNTISVNGLRPDADSSFTITLKAGGASAYGYINTLVVERIFDDGSAPAAPKNLAATLTANNSASLTWTSVAYNESGYTVFRATNPAGPFTSIGTTAAKATGFVDSLTSGGTTYYYQVQSFNSHGTSAFTPAVQVSIPAKTPVLATIADQYLRGDQTVNVAVTASYGTSSTLTLTATKLPPFATFTDNGNATGTLTLSPTNNQQGTFSGVTITAKDGLGNTSVKTFSIIVKDKNQVSVYVNFNQVNPEPWPWNSFNAAPNAGASITNLKDDINTATGINVTLPETWAGANNVGATTGNNSGVFNDNVMSTAYFESAATTRHINISGLNPAKQYSLVLFASRGGITDTRLTNFSVGAKTASLNAAGNTSNTVTLANITPDASGNVVLNVAKDASSSYAYINAMVIQQITAAPVNNTPATPTTLVAYGQSRTSITLNWKDLATNETAYEIWRSDTYNGTFSLIDTVAANATAYTNTGLPQNSRYYYKVRAKNNTVFSSYSNMAGAGVLTYLVYIQFNKDSAAGAPWNSTNALPQAESTFGGFLNDANNPTGLSLTVVDGGFSGVNPYGKLTGNNSGIYPDNVLRSTWWLDVSSTGTLRINGLNQATKYNFVFSGSRDGNGDNGNRTTQYTVGGVSAYLNCTDNTTKTTQINGIVPDANGAATVSVKAGPGSSYGYIGSLVIQAFDAADTSGSTSPFSRTTRTPLVAARVDSATTDANVITSIGAYPNPISDDVTLRLKLQKPVDRANVVITDFTGRIVFTRELRNLNKGDNNLKLGTNAAGWPHGIYLVKVLGIPGKEHTTISIMK